MFPNDFRSSEFYLQCDVCVILHPDGSETELRNTADAFPKLKSFPICSDDTNWLLILKSTSQNAESV